MPRYTIDHRMRRAASHPGEHRSHRSSCRYGRRVGLRNFLIEGVSGAGKTSVCVELRRRGYHAVNGDTDLAYQGDPATGEPTDVPSHWHHIWRVGQVRDMVADRSESSTFSCGGSRNRSKFIDLFDAVFVLEIDLDTLHERLGRRPEDEFGGRPAERDFVVQLHRSQEDRPEGGIPIDATAPLAAVVDEIVARAIATPPRPFSRAPD